MSDERNHCPNLTPAGRRSAAQKQERLAAALRDNLRKRKAQQRARAEAGPPSEGGAGEGGSAA